MISHQDAALVVEQGLAAVFDPGLVRQLREDSPLSSVGMVAADAVCLSDAIGGAAAAAGWRCALDDAAWDGVETVGRLVEAVERCAEALVGQESS